MKYDEVLYLYGLPEKQNLMLKWGLSVRSSTARVMSFFEHSCDELYKEGDYYAMRGLEERWTVRGISFLPI